MALMKPLYQQANTYDAVHDRGLIGDIFDVEGVIRPGGGALLVGPRPTANMSVDVAAGACVVAGDDAAGQGSYLCRSTAVENLPIGPAPGSNSRIDLVIARVRDATVTGGVSSDWLLEVIPGTAAASPAPPDVPASAIALAQVLVPAGAATITLARITDRRPTAASAAYAPKASPTFTGTVTASGVASSVMRTYEARQNGAETTTSTVYAALATAVTVDLTAPPSGIVDMRWGAQQSAGGNFALTSIEVTLVSSGAAFYTGGDAVAAQNASSNAESVASETRISGLTAGAVYRFALRHRVSGGTGSFQSRFLVLTPST